MKSRTVASDLVNRVRSWTYEDNFTSCGYDIRRDSVVVACRCCEDGYFEIVLKNEKDSSVGVTSSRTTAKTL